MWSPSLSPQCPPHNKCTEASPAGVGEAFCSPIVPSMNKGIQADCKPQYSKYSISEKSKAYFIAIGLLLNFTKRHIEIMAILSGTVLPARALICLFRLLTLEKGGGANPRPFSTALTKSPPETILRGTPRKCRAGPIITCTKEQVGRLSSVSLLPTSSFMGREACNPQIQVGIPYKRCGFNGP